MIIFLDFDGVLRRLSSHVDKFDHDCLFHFENAVRIYTNIKIVVTSTWRLEYSLDQIKELFSSDIADKIIGVTPESMRLTKYYRYNEILLYLKINNFMDEKWIAINDDQGHFPNNCPLIITDSEMGFTFECGEKIRNYCNDIEQINL